MENWSKGKILGVLESWSAGVLDSKHSKTNGPFSPRSITPLLHHSWFSHSIIPTLGALATSKPDLAHRSSSLKLRKIPW
jgi:hypothetical protein